MTVCKLFSLLSTIINVRAYIHRVRYLERFKKKKKKCIPIRPYVQTRRTILEAFGHMQRDDGAVGTRTSEIQRTERIKPAGLYMKNRKLWHRRHCKIKGRVYYISNDNSWGLKEVVEGPRYLYECIRTKHARKYEGEDEFPPISIFFTYEISIDIK